MRSSLTQRDHDELIKMKIDSDKVHPRTSSTRISDTSVSRDLFESREESRGSIRGSRGSYTRLEEDHLTCRQRISSSNRKSIDWADRTCNECAIKRYPDEISPKKGILEN